MNGTDENSALLSSALDLGQRLLECGASVNRVEDTIGRICRSYGAERTDVFAITSSIVVTMKRGGDTVTQTRRITVSGTDLDRLESLNDLSRHICAEKPPVDKLTQMLRTADGSAERQLPILLGYILASGSFALLFGGSVPDAACAMGIAVLIRLMDRYLRTFWNNSLLHSLTASLFSGLLALMCAGLGWCGNADMVMIGDIMLLIPGIALTNALRDLFSGDTITGMLRLMEALLQAGMVALGFALAVILKGVAGI